jgi:hypothetical protein
MGDDVATGTHGRPAVDEGVRMDEHPGIVFRDGPAGRRATVVGGPDVWEIVRAVRSGRDAEPELSEDELLAMLEENLGIAPTAIHRALGYWSAYPGEVDAMMDHAERVEAEASAGADRAASVLRP